MEIKSKVFINKGFNSNAYIINDEYILLKGNNKDSFDNYTEYSKSLSLLSNIKSVQIPKIIELIAPNNEYPNGAMIYRMIKGNALTEDKFKNVDYNNLAKQLAEFMNEIYEIPVIFDKNTYIESELKYTKENIKLLKQYFNIDKYNLILSWYDEYVNYLKNFDDYHFIHGDLWYENYIIDENNKLVGIVDFENARFGDPARDIAALNYLGNDFINEFLKYYKYNNDDLLKRISMFVKYREIMSFKSIIDNHPEEIKEQIEKLVEFYNK